MWIAVGAWLSVLTCVIHWAMPDGYYFDGKMQPWAPAWIPMVLGLGIFSIGLIPFIATKLTSRRAPDARPADLTAPRS